jgi:hypothetical protein
MATYSAAMRPQADLTECMGADAVANVSKQLPISIAYQNTGCE